MTKLLAYAAGLAVAGWVLWEVIGWALAHLVLVIGCCLAVCVVTGLIVKTLSHPKLLGGVAGHVQPALTAPARLPEVKATTGLAAISPAFAAAGMCEAGCGEEAGDNPWRCGPTVDGEQEIVMLGAGDIPPGEEGHDFCSEACLRTWIARQQVPDPRPPITVKDLKARARKNGKGR